MNVNISFVRVTTLSSTDCITMKGKIENQSHLEMIMILPQIAP